MRVSAGWPIRTYVCRVAKFRVLIAICLPFMAHCAADELRHQYHTVAVGGAAEYRWTPKHLRVRSALTTGLAGPGIDGNIKASNRKSSDDTVNLQWLILYQIPFGMGRRAPLATVGQWQVQRIK
jgi:hypothetical protein